MPELRLKRGDVFRLEGQLSLRVRSGRVSVSGGLYEEGSRLVVPRAKSIPLDAEEDAVIEYSVGRDGKVERLPGRTIPQAWDGLVDEVALSRPRVILVMGDVDTGKTFFTSYLANKLLARGIRVAAVDGDVGQAEIGPPTTIGMGVFERPAALLHQVPLRRAYFVGSTSPAGHMLEFAVGVKGLVERGLNDADLVAVNTPGWISGPGRALQLRTIELISPDLVVALQRGDELEHVLMNAPPKVIRRLPISSSVRPRSAAERSLLRGLALARYFNDASRLVLDLHRVKLGRCYLYTGKPVDVETLHAEGPIVHAELIPEGLLLVSKKPLGVHALEALKLRFRYVHQILEGAEARVLAGLIGEDGELLGLGIIERIDYRRRRMVVISPIRDADGVEMVQFGSIKVKPTGEEVGAVKPGTF